MQQAMYLDPALLKKLDEIMKSSRVFENDAKKHLNLVRAVSDRLALCALHLNANNSIPCTDVDFKTFLMYGSEIVEAVKSLVKANVITNGKRSESRYFKPVCEQHKFYQNGSTIPATDDSFFSHFRALVFAHSFGADTAPFLQQGEVQYAPCVVVPPVDGSYVEKLWLICPDAVGVKLYSNKRTDIEYLVVSHSRLCEYIQDRYIYVVRGLIKWAEVQIKNFVKRCKKYKVKRIDGDTKGTLLSVSDILRKRYEDNSAVERLLSYISCDLTLLENTDIVSEYLSYVDSHIDELCAMVDEMEAERYNRLLTSMIYVSFPCIRDSFTGYKEYGLLMSIEDLDLSSGKCDPVWYRTLATEFYKNFASRYVTILPQDMSFTEIKLLIAAACYAESCKCKV